MRLASQCAPPEQDRVVIAAAGSGDTVVFGGARGRIWRGHNGAAASVGDLSGWVTCIAESGDILAAGSCRGELMVVTDNRVRIAAVDAAILEIVVTPNGVLAWDVAGRCWILDEECTPVESRDDYAPTARVAVARDAEDAIELSAGDGTLRIDADDLLAMAPESRGTTGLVALMLDAARAVLCTGSGVFEVDHRLPDGTGVPVMVVADRSGPTLARLEGAVGDAIRGVVRTADGRLVARVERMLAGGSPVATWTTGLTRWDGRWVVCTGAATVVIRDGDTSTSLDVSGHVGPVVGVVTVDASRLLICGMDGRTAMYTVNRGVAPALAGNGCVVGARSLDEGAIATWRRTGQVQVWREVAA
ncbi:MAG: hypothetical protein JST91_31275 [Actinobacteria bacterium]|nr:hypothetical protein [Actinomycetota bacterium]